MHKSQISRESRIHQGDSSQMKKGQKECLPTLLGKREIWCSKRQRYRDMKTRWRRVREYWARCPTPPSPKIQALGGGNNSFLIYSSEPFLSIFRMAVELIHFGQSITVSLWSSWLVNDYICKSIVSFNNPEDGLKASPRRLVWPLIFWH